jgi:hypothetical protein
MAKPWKTDLFATAEDDIRQFGAALFGLFVDCAWQRGKQGLAALMAVIWDSMLSPGDARALTPGQRARDTQGAIFFLDRAKTGRAAVGTLTPWSEQILENPPPTEHGGRGAGRTAVVMCPATDRESGPAPL